MRILSIGFGDKKKVKYEKVNNAGITETYQLVTEDDFSNTRDIRSICKSKNASI